jgi:hypothetical protein
MPLLKKLNSSCGRNLSCHSISGKIYSDGFGEWDPRLPRIPAVASTHTPNMTRKYRINSSSSRF